MTEDEDLRVQHRSSAILDYMRSALLLDGGQRMVRQVET
jgi:hypothetical protein